jgi:Dolichyl-phosphate-mannose-protein mannosyltransferase
VVQPSGLLKSISVPAQVIHLLRHWWSAFFSKKDAHLAIHPAIALLIACAIFLASIGLIGIDGDFPLNDDWAYVTTVQNLVTNHDWRPSDWSGMIMFSQSLWGASFCAFFSCSYELLRISSLAAAAITMLVSFALFVMADAEASHVLAGLLIVAFNPAAFALSYTFMTDTFFTMTMIISIYFFLMHLKSERTAYLALALAAAVAATLCRQVGLCVPAAYLVVRVLKPGEETFLKRLGAAALPLLACGIIYIGFTEWMRLTGRQSLNYNRSILFIWFGSIPTLFVRTNAHISMVLLYSGLFLSPLLLVTKLASAPAIRVWRWASTAISLLFVLISAVGMILVGVVMPFGVGVLVPEGIGPLTLRDTYILHQPDVVRLPLGFWIAVTSVGLLGQFLLVQRIVDYAIAVFGRRRGLMLDPADLQPLMALMTAAIYCAPVILIPRSDRYLVPLAPLLAYWLLATGRSAWTTALAPALSALVCATLVVYSVLGTHDYLAWNRVRWQALTDLERSGAADFRSVDGGFEYNGLRGYDERYQPPPEKSWWWVHDDAYVVSFGRIEGYEPVKRYKYLNTLLPGLRTVYLLHRQAASATP